MKLEKLKIYLLGAMLAFCPLILLTCNQAHHEKYILQFEMPKGKLVSGKRFEVHEPENPEEAYFYLVIVTDTARGELVEAALLERELTENPQDSVVSCSNSAICKLNINYRRQSFNVAFMEPPRSIFYVNEAGDKIELPLINILAE